MNKPQVKAVLKEFGVASSALSDRAVKQLAREWASLPQDDFEAMKAALLRLYPQIATRAAMAQAGLSTAVYSAVRDAQGVREPFSPPAAAVPATAKLYQHVSYAVGKMYTTRDLDVAFKSLSGDMTKYAMDASRESMIANVSADGEQNPSRKPPRWSIEPEPGACDYCEALGSDFRYRSAETAQATFHKDCKCDVVPEW